MKSIYTTLFFLFTIISSNFSISQESSLEKWNSLLNKKGLAVYFAGIFDKMGFIIEGENEEFTVIHFADHFTIQDGIVADSVDYVVRLKPENIENMLKHGADNTIDENESFKIMAVLFTPLTQASLSHPVFNKASVRLFSGLDNHIHVSLISPDKKDTVSHTLIYLNKKWMVIPGLHGKAKRYFELAPKDTIEFQKEMFKALKSEKMKNWRAFKKWYMLWRKDVSITLEN